MKLVGNKMNKPPGLRRGNEHSEKNDSEVLNSFHLFGMVIGEIMPERF